MTMDLPRLRREARGDPGDQKVAIRRHRRRGDPGGRGRPALFDRMLRATSTARPHWRRPLAELEVAPARLETLLRELEKAGVLAFLWARATRSLMSGHRLPRAPPRHCSYWLRAVYEHPLLGADRDRQGHPRAGDRLRLREVPLHRGRLRAHGASPPPTPRRR